MSPTVLSFGAHPDDIEFGCGGTEAMLAARGCRIVHAVLTSGESGGRGVKPEELARTREHEAIDAARVLGVLEVKFFRYLDGLTQFSREMKVELIRLLRRLRPQTVFVHSSQDSFPDHRIVHQLVMSALTAAAGPWYAEAEGDPHRVSQVYGYEVWHPLSSPQTYMDVSGSITKKIEALKCHRSQMGPIPYDEAALGLARYRGTLSMRGRYAEAFEVLCADFHQD